MLQKSIFKYIINTFRENELVTDFFWLVFVILDCLPNYFVNQFCAESVVNSVTGYKNVVQFVVDVSVYYLRVGNDHILGTPEFLQFRLDVSKRPWNGQTTWFYSPGPENHLRRTFAEIVDFFQLRKSFGEKKLIFTSFDISPHSVQFSSTLDNSIEFLNISGFVVLRELFTVFSSITRRNYSRVSDIKNQ